MKTARSMAGVWIDHSRAVIATLTDRGEKTMQILSHVDRQPRRIDGQVSRTVEPVAIDDKAMRSYHAHLNKYYDKVIAAFPRAGSVLIFGPGMAKQELAARIGKKRFSGRVVGVETTDKMTERQITARVRRHFAA